MTLSVLVTGSHGKTGKCVVKAVSKRGGKVTAFVRDISQENEMLNIGASAVVLGDMMDISSIGSAMEGIDAVIHIGPPMHPNEKEMTKNFINAALSSKVDRFIYYSVMHPLRRSVRHHQLKLDTEEILIESGLPYTILQPIRYMQHLEPIWERVLNEGVHAMPFNIDLKFNVVDLWDVAEATSIVTLEDGWLYGTYELAGPEPLSQHDMAEIISLVIKRDVKAEQIPIDIMKQKSLSLGLPKDRVDQMVIMNSHYDKYGFLGNPRILETILNRKPLKFFDYVERIYKDN